MLIFLLILRKRSLNNRKILIHIMCRLCHMLHAARLNIRKIYYVPVHRRPIVVFSVTVGFEG